MATNILTTLSDKYEKTSGRVYVNGLQALVLACMLRRRVDAENGIKTAGFVSGYRGSPVGTLDSELWKAEKFLGAHDVIFQPGVNEDLAATSVWGTQQVHIDGAATYDGVFGMWYGKGAGLDRCGDVMRHAHGAGTTPLGGVLAVCGDDHTLKSSSQAYYSEIFFMDMLMPVLYPSDIQEALDYAILGWELSRYSGCWVGFKVLAEVANSTSSVLIDLNRYKFIRPDETGLSSDRHLRWPDPWPSVEKRHFEAKLPAALAFARANRIDKEVVRSNVPRMGIVTAGKSYLDVLEALRILGLSVNEAADLGISIYKVGMPWPLEPEGITEFACRQEMIFVIEEKRGFIEGQLKDFIYNEPASKRPQIIGRRDENGAALLPNIQDVTPDRIAHELAKCLPELGASSEVSKRLDLMSLQSALTEKPISIRTPYFCSGCPHSTSTKVPEGSRALAGVGCHYMAVGMNRNTETFSQMGGEGVPWIGTAPFSKTKHVFVNIGEGTYFHSGYLAIRASIAAKVNMTYKILFNDAVAMTGGQPVDGQLTVPQITQQMFAEGVTRIEVVTDQMDRYGSHEKFAPGVRISDRADLNKIQKEMSEVKGVSVLVYDQECATEKRRRRKRGEMIDPAKRIFINDLVCEGCGDCSKKSNCLSVIPKETEFGRKRQIDQSACNKDYSCVNGFCPSFVAIVGGELNKSPKIAIDLPLDDIPRPRIENIQEGATYNILVTGVGGTGVVTIGALIAMAAHLEGKGFAVHDSIGMAQKFGGVSSHVRIASSMDEIHAVQIPCASADVLLGGDLIVTALPKTLSLVNPDKTQVLINSNQTVTGEFVQNLNFDFKNSELTKRICDSVKTDVESMPATDIAVALTGDAIGANLFLLGYACQKGWLPVSLESIELAIDINGIAVKNNKYALALGRYGAVDMAGLLAAISADDNAESDIAVSLDDIIAKRENFLINYQDKDYANQYRILVEHARMSDIKLTQKAGAFTEAVARYYFKLMAYKDEYEVARLYSDPRFVEQIKQKFTGQYKLKLYMAPPLISQRDADTGELKKREFGAWVLVLFKLLTKLKGLRGTVFDIFGYTFERRQERELIKEYSILVENIINDLSAKNYEKAVELASLPDQMRGFGHVKERAIEIAKTREKELLSEFYSSKSSGIPTVANYVSFM